MSRTGVWRWTGGPARTGEVKASRKRAVKQAKAVLKPSESKDLTWVFTLVHPISSSAVCYLVTRWIRGPERFVGTRVPRSGHTYFEFVTDRGIRRYHSRSRRMYR